MTRTRLLLVDAGNTNVKFGLAGADGAIESYSLPTAHLATADAMGLAIDALCRHARVDVTDLSAFVVSSVVPRLNPLLRAAARRYARCEALFVPGDIPLPLENRYLRPAEVGADRLVGAYAATRLFPAPGHLVIDFGTATTFDCVAHGAYLGGLICPGLLSSAQGLAGGTAKLPQADFLVEEDEVDVGTSTAKSLNHGLVFGFAAMVEGLCARLLPKLPAGAPVIATGGFAEIIRRVCPVIAHNRPDLLMEGLRLAYLDNPVYTPAAP
ncbi:putative transcriptional acitvator, Baf family [Alkalidesulfovibrio alkalitolerans DSM 16529]|jgi:type III pantothenate kinase|uniref:Type III pantothenate kinase n=1 Tax=Alkalidesulfovibrio alkalitolerans DSM 16529 TaxID=1121439 RepID=S7TEX0_9BACT|nr:type III pantothenate kinase [Alkalidesulfovibrio alkalitolerans]EPR35150.1 putative transcriptional acitvator, Baf family [Alkalidesulfovibrio alkalitolerans DSM 16529]